ncbi:MAG: multicopper oxidase family protein, partial [Caldilineaceae bacterium]|nr:multicopper oxidase family protein [Caldilineaceae bacterium]
MTKLTKYFVWTGVLALLLAVAFLPLPAQAQATVNIDLCATAGTATMPDGVSVPVWGYALGNCTAAPTVSQPGGPVLEVNQGDTVVVTLYNSLPEATGMLFHGQSMPPDRTGAALLGSTTYTFVAEEAGTYLYEAGLLPNTYHQSAMGLHGVLVVRPATAGQAYNSASTAYDVEAVMLLSEIDPALNNSAAPASFDMRGFKARYQLINGVAYPDTQPIAVTAGNRVLLRYVNGGALHHSMGVLGMTQRVVAIDGSLRPNAYSVIAETVAPGSSIDAIATVPAAGRTIVFDVSGYIRLPSGSDGTRITSSKITIAGQTAPGDGIGFYNNFLRISGDDVVLRHLRFRRGKTESSGDCIDLDSGSLNSMLDHLSVMFSTDENFSSFGSPPENLTFQYSLNSWGLEPHSCGGLWDQNHASSHHNLWSHNHTRNPKARPNGLLEWVNNVTFDWDIGFIMGDSGTPAGWKANVINNYFICPPGNTRSKALVKGTVDRNGAPNFTVHLSGNLTDNNGADTILNGTDKGYSIVEGTAYPPGTTGLTPGAAGYYQSPSAIAGSPAGITTDPALLAYKKIVSNAGALRLSHNFGGSLRDEVDTILINKLTSMSRGHVTRPSDTGASNAGFGTLNSTTPPIDSDKDGMPDSYETALGWNPSVQDHNTTVSGTAFFPTGYPAGYTRLEEYLHFKSVPHMVIAKNTATNPDIDLSRYTSGFTNNPVFTISNI